MAYEPFKVYQAQLVTAWTAGGMIGTEWTKIKEMKENFLK